MAETYYRQTLTPNQPRQTYKSYADEAAIMAQITARRNYTPPDGDPANYNPPIHNELEDQITYPDTEKLFKDVDGWMFEQIGNDSWRRYAHTSPELITKMNLIEVVPGQVDAVKSTLQQYYRGEITAAQIASPT